MMMNEMNNDINGMNGVNGMNGNAGDDLDLKLLANRLLARWKWFAVSVPACLALAFLYCQARVPVYSVSAKVMISDSKKGELGANAMMKELGLASTDMFVENEIVELQSRNLAREVARELDLNARYYREGFPRDRELYGNPPARVLVDDPGAIRDTSLYLVLDTATVRVLTPGGEPAWEGPYSSSVDMGGYHLVVERNGAITPGDRLRVDLRSDDRVAGELSRNLSVQLLVKNTNSVQVTVRDAVPARGVAIVNALVNLYNRNGIENKRQVSAATVDFINERLSVINRELGTIERDAESFKKSNNLTDLTSDAARVMERKKLAESELLKLQTELDVLRGVSAALERERSRSGEFTLLPENLGLTDESLNAGITRYNEMVLRRGKLLQSASESNPIVTGLDVQLRDLRENIRATVSNVEDNLLIKLRGLERESASVDNLLKTVPTREKEFRAIARQQELKENLFLFLMQKREEAEIAKLVYVATAKIIEDPRAGDGPVEPRKAMVMLLGLLLGLAIPGGLVYLVETLDDRVRSVDEVKRGLPFPLLGDVPELDAASALSGDDFNLSESMQVARERLDYMLGGVACPVILVTSGVPGEGKSLVSARLAGAIARAGKRVLLVGCDLRNPRLHAYFGEGSRRRGLSAYLAGMEESWEPLVLHVDDNLDVLPGGAVPPNPVALLSGDRLERLLEGARGRYDRVILDTPPAGILADALALLKRADALVIVARLNVLPRGMMSTLRSLGGERGKASAGVIVNGVPRRFHYYKYGYGHYYGRGDGGGKR